MNLRIIIKKLSENGYIKYSIPSLLIVFVLILLFRGLIAQILFEHKCNIIKNRYGLSINAGEVGFSGIRTIYVDNLTAKPEGRDTIAFINRAEVKLNFTDLMLLKINPLEIWINKPKINLVGNKENSNYLFLLDNHRKDRAKDSDSASYSLAMRSNHQKTIFTMVKAILGLTTAKYHVNNFSFSYSDSAYTTLISISRFESNSMGFNTQIEVRENGEKYFINLNGFADKKKSSIAIKSSMVGGKKSIPLFSHKFGIDISFDTLDLRIDAKELNIDNIHLEVKSSVESLSLYSPHLSDQMVKVKRGGFDLDIKINSEHYLIDSSSTVNLNGLNAKIYLSYTHSHERSLAFKVSTGTFQSQKLFDALPDGLFTNLKGIKTAGTIDYCLDFKIKFDNLDSINLNPKLTTKGFSITQYGFRNFSALNDTFSYDIYDEGQFIKTIFLGSKNKNFRTLSQTSRLIIDAIVTSEDGGFFNNNGFDLEAFKYAISEDIKQKRFARGGSTITMQLIKNLYLNQNKNLFRKAEEYLIVWLIGGQGIVSKERMMEIYLNIIEWGPDIYGVNEACHYYFGKDPKDISLDEAIYLASIIPRPKKFKYLFDRDGNLKSFMEEDFRFIASKMLQREMITVDQFNALLYNVKLTGAAKDVLRDSSDKVLPQIWER